MQALLAPVSLDAPAGPDLSYDGDRQVIEQAFDTPPDEVEWDRTIDRIVAQAAETRDLWLAVYLARAGARAGRLDRIENGVELLAGYLEGFWGSAHPTVEEYGIEGRKGACESLVRIGEFLAPLRRVPLIEHPRLGLFSGGDFERFAAEGAAADGYGQFRAAVADTPVERIAEQLDRIGRIRAAVARADAVLSDEAAKVGQTGTNFTTTYEALDAIAEAVRPHVHLDPVGDDGAAVAIGEEAPVANGRARAMTGRVESREDVARALDAVIEYYGRVEPSSPIPLALGRVKAWIAMDFMSILNDIAPGSTGEALTVLRSRSEDGGSPDLM
ncbi:ImpA family type VI secretion system protein [Sphingomonas sp. ac-8]|uniref:type VI secretion system protein TssA n=1 Tax=Sphingomonas sp. ac-8 TaxID=3242977 RepID=UPI003A80CF6F